MTPERIRRRGWCLRVLVLLTCIPASAHAQSPSARLAGMWSDPPVTPEGLFCWTADSIKAGERVTVTGNPTHTGSQRLFFRGLVRTDGTELLPGNAQRLNAIEEERRRRARQRDQQK